MEGKKYYVVIILSAIDHEILNPHICESEQDAIETAAFYEKRFMSAVVRTAYIEGGKK